MEARFLFIEFLIRIFYFQFTQIKPHTRSVYDFECPTRKKVLHAQFIFQSEFPIHERFYYPCLYFEVLMLSVFEK